jgi:peptidyl-prolyl cis-trans isomerase A (cyclophilin A)
VFGKVLKGMDVLDKIAALPTRAMGPFAGDVPDPLVVITQADVVGDSAPAAAASTAPDAAAAPASKPGKKATTVAKPRSGH